MYVVRPVLPEDLDQLYELSKLTTFGLTTLPKDREILRKRIIDSTRGFETADDTPSGESYLFVLEESGSGKIVGTSGIVSKVGGFEPFYAYRIEKAVHESKMLNVHKEIRVLHLVMEHNGPCEIGSLFLLPQYRGGGNGRLLSLSRFLFMADHPQQFEPTVIAEMRGVIDEMGRSPFWDAVGRHFFDIDFPKADYLSMVNKRFIGELMPRYPIYIPLLPVEAQAAIGHVHDKTAPALAILETEGFRFNNMVDIFEAGPVVSCERDQIRAIRQSLRAPLLRLSDDPIKSEYYIISNTKRDFRACSDTLEIVPREGIVVSRQTASALEVEAGDSLCVVKAKAG